MSQILPKSQKLYDLTINWQTENTNHLLSKSTNFLVHYGFTHSPFGTALVMGTKKGICGIAFTDQLGDEETLRDMMQRWPGTTFMRSDYLSGNTNVLRCGFSDPADAYEIVQESSSGAEGKTLGFFRHVQSIENHPSPLGIQKYSKKPMSENSECYQKSFLFSEKSFF